MNNKRKNSKYYSIEEFEKEFFPKAYKQKVIQKPMDPQSLGASLAKESLDKIRKRLGG